MKTLIFGKYIRKKTSFPKHKRKGKLIHLILESIEPLTSYEILGIYNQTGQLFFSSPKQPSDSRRGLVRNGLLNRSINFGDPSLKIYDSPRVYPYTMDEMWLWPTGGTING